MSDFYLANTFEFKNLARQMFPCVLHCIAQNRHIIQTDTTLRNYSADPKFEEFFRLLRHDSCFYFTTAVIEIDTDHYYVYKKFDVNCCYAHDDANYPYDEVIDIDASNSSDTEVVDTKDISVAFGY